MGKAFTEPVYKLTFACASESVPEALGVLLESFPLERIVIESGACGEELSVYGLTDKELLDFTDQKRSALFNVSLKKLTKKDWIDPWKKKVRPFALTDTYRVVPVWDEQLFKNSGKDILIDTDLSFGMGDHPTTRMLAGMIERKISPGESFLDVGTGTGILSVLAHKLGASKITALDNDKEAVNVAKKNLKRNGCSQAEVICGDIKDIAFSGEFDLLAANLDTEQLAGLHGKLASLVKKGGYLAVSGVSKEKSGYFLEKFKDERLDSALVFKERCWCAFLFEKIC